MTASSIDKRAPMASAPMKYLPDGSADWGNMWDSFCALALDGGPPHRATVLVPDLAVDTSDPAYQQAAHEIGRGVLAVSGLHATPGPDGWLAIACPSAGMALWLAEAVEAEHVAARAEGSHLLVPVGAHFTLTGEIKNVITAVAKTTHYWADHVPAEAKNALELQARFAAMRRTMRTWFRRR